MYSGSVLNLNNSKMTATGMKKTGSSNINCFYSGDLRTKYDAINITNSEINFHDNHAGGFAINNVNIHVTDSIIKVNNNLGNACNSGRWYVDNSNIQMNGNRGGHGLSCVAFDMEDSTFEVLHNGYSGVYVTDDSSFKNCKVDIRCNGEKLLSYSAGDVWLNGHKLSVSGTTDSSAQSGSLWLGAVGRKGKVETIGYSTVVAYDLNSNAADNLKSNTAPVLEDAVVTLNTESDQHTLFLNPFMETKYARGNGENTTSNNDVDLFKDDQVTDEADIIGKDNAKIGTMTTAQLSHHIYNWSNGTVVKGATEDCYGVVSYECNECDNFENHTGDHSWSFDCAGTYVYAPLVGIHFDPNTTDTGTNMPSDQLEINYEGTTDTILVTTPVREGYTLPGWNTDKDCTKEFDFNEALTTNYTVVYAKWTVNTPVDVTPEDPETPEKTPSKESAKTGDTTHITLYITLAGISFTLCSLVLLRRKFN